MTANDNDIGHKIEAKLHLLADNVISGTRDELAELRGAVVSRDKEIQDLRVMMLEMARDLKQIRRDQRHNDRAVDMLTSAINKIKGVDDDY